MKAEIISLPSRMPPEVTEQISTNLFLSIRKIGSSVFVNVWSRESCDTTSLVNMVIEQKGRTITLLSTDLTRVSEALTEMGCANV